MSEKIAFHSSLITRHLSNCKIIVQLFSWNCLKPTLAKRSFKMTVQAKMQSQSYPFLRRVLQADALTSGLSGALFVLGSGAVASFLGQVAPWTIVVVGLLLLGFAAEVYYFAVKEPLNQSGVVGIIAANIVWVLGSWLLLLSGWVSFSTAGWWAVAIVADVVAVFAALQWYGLKRK
jgi:hypothetical protein